MNETGSTKKRRGRPPKVGELKSAAFQTRLRPSLRARLREDADRNDVSLSEEIERRLEASYARVEDRFGGPIGLNTAIMLFADFRFSGDVAAANAGHPEWTIAEWIREPSCSERALAQLVLSVWSSIHPDAPYQGLYHWLEELARRVQSRELTRAMNAGGEPLSPEAEAKEREGWKALWAALDEQGAEAPEAQASPCEALAAPAVLEQQHGARPARKRRSCRTG